MMDAAMGAMVLGQIEEVSLEEILSDLRTSLTNHPTRLKYTHLPSLDALAATHLRETQSPTISLSGRFFPLLYRIVSTLISPPHTKALFILDLDGRFDATRLTCTSEDLQHVYIHQPARSSPESLRALVSEAENFMLYEDGAGPSRHREWWGTMVLGGLAAGDLTAGWKGWLRVERTQVPSFALGLSALEAWQQREQRQRAVDKSGWSAACRWGAFDFEDA